MNKEDAERQNRETMVSPRSKRNANFANVRDAQHAGGPEENHNGDANRRKVAKKYTPASSNEVRNPA